MDRRKHLRLCLPLVRPIIAVTEEVSMRIRRSQVLIPAMVIALIVVLAACGAEDPTPTPRPGRDANPG